MMTEYQSTEVWVASGDCPFCKYTFLRITQTKRPGPVVIDEGGQGRFSFMLTYEWTCAGCNATGPLSHIDNT